MLGVHCVTGLLFCVLKTFCGYSEASLVTCSGHWAALDLAIVDLPLENVRWRRWWVRGATRDSRSSVSKSRNAKLLLLGVLTKLTGCRFRAKGAPGCARSHGTKLGSTGGVW